MENCFRIIVIFVQTKMIQAMKKYYYEGPTFRLWRKSWGPTFEFWGGSRGPRFWGPGPTFTPCMLIRTVREFVNGHSYMRQGNICWYKSNNVYIAVNCKSFINSTLIKSSQKLTLFKMGLFEVVHGWGREQSGPTMHSTPWKCSFGGNNLFAACYCDVGRKQLIFDLIS